MKNTVFMILLFALFNQPSHSELTDETAFKALSPAAKQETQSNLSTWRAYCATLKGDAAYTLSTLEHFGAVHFKCVCDDASVALRNPRKLPSDVSPLDLSLFKRAGGTCPISVVKAVVGNKAPTDYCSNTTLAKERDGTTSFADLTKKSIFPSAKQKDREVLTLNEPKTYTATLAEVKASPGILYLGHLPNLVKQYHLVEVKEGKLYLQGKLLDTLDSIHVVSPGGLDMPSPKAIFVIDKNGDLYVSKMSIRDKFHHSTFLSGDDVISAGMIIVKQGKILYIDNESGHYLPKDCNFKNGIMAIKEKGYNFDGTVNYKIVK